MCNGFRYQYTYLVFVMDESSLKENSFRLICVCFIMAVKYFQTFL